MYNFRAPALRELAAQLARGPTRLRLRQLLGIEFLLTVIEPGKSYPAEFICHALTGYRKAAGREAARDEELVDADTLTCDLVDLAEMLSDDAKLDMEQWAGPVYSIADLAARFDVSTKTIFRWRRRGLVGWKFRYPDRRMRVAFPDLCVRRFVAAHADIVHRGSSFSQLTKQERQAVIERAQVLFTQGYTTVNAVAKVLAAETTRAVETIRLILKSHDEAHPGEGIFNRSKLEVAPDDQRLVLWEAYQDGTPIPALADRYGRPVAWIYRVVTQMRARDRKARQIEYIPSPEFENPELAASIENDPACEAPYACEGNGHRRVPSDLPPYLQHLFQLPLLTKAGEVALFRKMNFLKFQAERLRAAIDPDHTTASELDQIDGLLDGANALKNQITQANLRLVVSIAKRHMSPTLDFFEIVSDGNLSLMRAVDKFDCSRGFKFSTYASWAIIRNYARLIPEQRHQRDRYQTGRDELLESTPMPVFDERDEEQSTVLRGMVERMLDTLDARERKILRERIRQLETRAMCKLRGEFEHDVQRVLGA